MNMPHEAGWYPMQRVVENSAEIRPDIISQSERRLGQCIMEICLDTQTLDRYQYLRKTLLVSTAILGLLAQIPYIPIAMKLGPVLGPITAASNGISFWAFTYWAGAGVINDMLGPKYPFEIAQTQKSACWIEASKYSLIFLLALASQLPTVLPGIRYANSNYKIVSGIILLLSGLQIPARSLQLLFERIKKLLIAAHKEAVITQSRLHHRVVQHRIAFEMASWEEKQEEIREWDEIRIKTAPAWSCRELITRIHLNETPPCQQQISLIGRTIGTGFGLAATCAYEYALATYTFVIIEQQIYDNQLFAGTCAGLVAGSTAYLFGSSLICTMRKVLGSCVEYFTGTYTPSLGYQLRPRFFTALTTIGLLMNLGALGPNYIIWSDFYPQQPWFPPVLLASLFFLLTTSLLDLVEDFTQKSINNTEHLAILHVHMKLRKIENLIDLAEPRECESYLEELPTSDAIQQQTAARTV